MFALSFGRPDGSPAGQDSVGALRRQDDLPAYLRAITQGLRFGEPARLSAGLMSRCGRGPGESATGSSGGCVVTGLSRRYEPYPAVVGHEDGAGRLDCYRVGVVHFGVKGGAAVTEAGGAAAGDSVDVARRHG